MRLGFAKHIFGRHRIPKRLWRNQRQYSSPGDRVAIHPMQQMIDSNRLARRTEPWLREMDVTIEIRGGRFTSWRLSKQQRAAGDCGGGRYRCSEKFASIHAVALIGK